MRRNRSGSLRTLMVLLEVNAGTKDGRRSTTQYDAIRLSMTQYDTVRRSGTKRYKNPALRDTNVSSDLSSGLAD